MAKLFANKFNLDQLPDPVKPSSKVEQASNIRIEPVEKKSLETQALNAQLHSVDNQKANIPTSDEILARQGVRKSTSTQYVSTTKIEPFGTRPVNQGGTEVKKPKEQDKAVSNIVLNSIKYGSVITDPKTAIAKIEQGNRTTNPNIGVSKIDQGDKVTNPKIQISRADQTTKITDPKIEITKVAVGDKITNPYTIINKMRVSDTINTPKIVIKKAEKDEFIVDPKIAIVKTQNKSYITNPKLDIQKVDVGDKITNPNLKIKSVEVGSKITNPNTKIKQIQEGDKITNPNIEVAPIKVGNRITNPDIKVVRVTANELITNPKLEINKVIPGDRVVDPKTVINKVEAGDRITIPNMVLSQIKTTDVTTYVSAIQGVGVTKFFPKTISLKDRHKQYLLGTTRHLPEFIVSDYGTGFLTITSPKVVGKLSLVKAQKVNYEKFILKQGGVENEYKGIYSYINITKFNKAKYNQGSVTIKKYDKYISKKSPVDIKKLSTTSIITNPKTQVTKVADNLIIDPQIRINVNDKVTIITDPKIKTQLPKQNVTIVPFVEVQKVAKADQLITNPNIKVAKATNKQYIVDPKIKNKIPAKAGTLTVLPKIDLTTPTKEGKAVTNPKLQITKAKIGSLVTDPKTAPKLVSPGSQITIPQVPIVDSIEIGVLTKDPQIKPTKVEQEDNKKSTAKDVPQFGDTRYNTTAVFPNDPNAVSPTTGQIVDVTQFDPTAVFPSDSNPIPNFNSTQTGVAYNNQYTLDKKFDSTNLDSPLKQAGESDRPTLTVTYYDGSAVTQQRTTNFPLTTYGDATVQGGYRALSYAQIGQRSQSSTRRNLDFSYTDNSNTQNYYTALGIPSTGADTLNKAPDASAKDFVTIKIAGIQFRSYLKSFSDSISANYSDVTYIGRPDVLKVFKNTTRQISLGFIVAAFSKDELSGIYGKLHKLIKSTVVGSANGAYVIGPMPTITVGNWIKDTPVVVNSLKFDTNPTEYSWDVDGQMPQLVDVSLDITVLSANGGKQTFLQDGTYIDYA